MIGGDTHKSSIDEKTGEVGLYGAISRPKGQMSVMNLLITLSRRTMGGKRKTGKDQEMEKASTKEAPGSGRREE